MAHGVRPISAARRGAGVVVLAAGLPVLVAVLLPERTQASYAVPVLLVLLLVVVSSAVGGLVVAVPGALVGFLVLNWVFTPPFGSLLVADASQAVVLVAYLSTALLVAAVTGTAARRSAEARVAQHEATTLAALAGATLGEQQTLRTLLERVREGFGSDGAEVSRRAADGWAVVESTGDTSGAVQAEARAGDDARIRLYGPTAVGLDGRLLATFGEAVATALEGRQLAERAAEAAALRAADQTRTALLHAVGHDLRTPLATLRTSTEGLAVPGLSEDDRRTLLQTAAEATARLSSLVDDLLDAGRLQAGVVSAHLEAVPLADVVDRALLGLDQLDRVHLEVPADLVALTDVGLAERVLGNLLQNALQHSPSGTMVTVRGRADRDGVVCDVIDHGPGLPPGRQVFRPFQRLSDRTDGGLGLGLAIAQGFTAAVGGTLTPRVTEGGGLTMRLLLPGAT